MKRSVGLLFLSLGFPFFSWAGICPATLGLEVSDFEIRKTATEIVDELFQRPAGIEAEVIQCLEEVTKISSIRESMPLAFSGGGRCIYRSPQKDHEIELFPVRAGRSLYLQTKVSNCRHVVRAYADFTFSPEGDVKLRTGPSGLALRFIWKDPQGQDVGGPLVYIGVAQMEKIPASLSREEAVAWGPAGGPSLN